MPVQHGAQRAALINRVPQALLSVLGVKSQGENQHGLETGVQATLDLLGFYQLRDKRIEAVTVAAGSGSGTVSGLTCPTGKVRFCHWASCQITVGAGESARFVIGTANNSATGAGGQFFPLGDWQLADIADPTTVTMVAYTNRPWWMEPGDTVSVRRNQVSGGNISYSFRVLFNEYDI